MLFWTLTACIPVLTTPGEPVSTEYVKPDNAWPAADSVPRLEAEGYAVGELVEHELALDQNGQAVDFWQFYGNVWVLDVSTIWCDPCQRMASTLQATADEYKADGFVYVTVLAEDLEGAVPDEADLDFWADTFGIVDQPILEDSAGFTTPLTGGQFPLLLVVGRDLRVTARVAIAEDALLREAIEDAL